MRFKQKDFDRDYNLIIILDIDYFFNLFDKRDDKLRLDYIDNLRVSNSSPIYKYDDLLFDFLSDNHLDFEII